jgi:Fic family protein
MDRTFEKIDNLVSTLSNLLPFREEDLQRLNKKIRLEFNYNSNHLEGNTLTYSETELLLIFDKTTGNHELREYEEMKAHDVAFEIIRDWAADPERFLSEAELRNLHKILLVRPFWKDALTLNGQWTKRKIQVGTYKEQPNSVQLQNGEIFHYASPEETPILMGELVDWYREEEEKKALHPVQLAALLHYRFVRIHPFDDGNGRMSRLLMNYVLIRHKLPPVVIKSADKKNYLFALNQADTGDIDAFVRYIGEEMMWSLELSIKAAKGESIEEDDDLQKEIEVWKRSASTSRLSALHRNDLLVYEIYHNGGIEELFREFEQQHRRFYDMFYAVKFYLYKNNNAKHTLEALTEEIGSVINSAQGTFVEAGEAPEARPEADTYTSISAGIHLSDYKYNEKAPFGVSSVLYVDLQPYFYRIVFDDKEVIRKKYDEYLKAEERRKIITDYMKQIFNEIKARSERK